MLDLDDKVDAASSIYQDALGLLTAMSHRKEVASNPTEKTLLHKSVGRLYLWGEDFADGKLRRVMMHSWDLANTILRLLVALAKALLKSNYYTLLRSKDLLIIRKNIDLWASHQ